MIVNRSRGVAALSVAGVAWGTSVPLSKVALAWLDPGWLTVARFAVAAAVLLAVVPRRKLRAAFSWQVLAWGAAGYGGAVLVQNIGVGRTSVTHASLLIGVGPVLIAVFTALWRHVVARPLAWVGFAVSLAGVAAVAGGGGGGATGAGDLLVLASTTLIAIMTVAQARLLKDRDPVAVTSIQFAGAALATLPFAACTTGLPPSPSSPWPPPRRCCRSRSSPTGSAGSPPRWLARSSTSSRWSARRSGSSRSATRSDRASCSAAPPS
jgi:O-acetylserine/cysteine efflux transporter